jgi:transcriptional regulator with XRE-family HTH domain
MLLGVRELRDWMERRRFSQKETAEYLGFSEPYLSRVMNSVTSIGLTNALHVERMTGIPVEAWESESERVKDLSEKTARKSRVSKEITHG